MYVHNLTESHPCIRLTESYAFTESHMYALKNHTYVFKRITHACI